MKVLKGIRPLALPQIIAEKLFMPYLLLGASKRLFDLLLTLAFDAASASTAQLLYDQVNLWRTSRSIAMALFFFTLEPIVFAALDFKLTGYAVYIQIIFVFLYARVLDRESFVWAINGVSVGCSLYEGIW